MSIKFGFRTKNVIVRETRPGFKSISSLKKKLKVVWKEAILPAYLKTRGKGLI